MRTAIYGIGNILLGDDGIGPAVVNYLAATHTFAEDITLEDLGTPSLDLPSYMLDFDKIIFIDAIADATLPPGTIRLYSREEIMAVPTGIRISPHEPSINDALMILDFAGKAPREVTLVGVVAGTLEGGVALSDLVAAAIPGAGQAVRTLIATAELRRAS